MTERRSRKFPIRQARKLSMFDAGKKTCPEVTRTILASDCFREITERHFSSGMDTGVLASSLRQRADRSLSNG